MSDPGNATSASGAHRHGIILPNVLLTSFYLILGAIFTHPLLFRITDCTPAADGSGDQMQTIWFFWWMKRALFTLHQNPYWTDAIYFPHGTGLGYHLCPFTNLQAITVSALTGAQINSAFVYNLLVLGSFAVTGLASFFLIRHLTRHSLAAFWGSILVTVSPYRLWHLNHLNLLSLGWGLFFVYFVIRTIERPRLREAICAALSFGALFHASLSDAWMVAFFLAVLFAFDARRIARDSQRRPILSHLGIAALLASLMVLPGLIALSRTDSAWDISWRDTVEFSADLRSFVIPAGQISFAARVFGLDGGLASGYGSEVFLGWMLIATCVAVIVFARRRISFRWLILAGILSVLSLGPTLKFGTYRLLDGWLPYRWLFETAPFLDLSRTPGRLTVLVHLCLVIFAAQGVAIWLSRRRLHGRSQKARGAWTAIGGTIVIVSALIFENTAGSVQLWNMIVPDVYHELSADTRIRAIYEGPIAERSQICNRYMYWQTIHEKNVANGYLTHRSRRAFDLLARIRGWRKFEKEERNELIAAGIDAIVFHDSPEEVRIVRLRETGREP